MKSVTPPQRPFRFRTGSKSGLVFAEGGAERQTTLARVAGFQVRHPAPFAASERHHAFGAISGNRIIPAASATPSPKTSAYANARLTYKIIPAPNHTFCYDVYVEGRLMIHQTSIPALPGAEGFKAKADAEKVARLVLEKIRKNEIPPTVTI
jgi:hypothetical protein